MAHERPLHYDRQGNPLALMEWSRLFHDADYKRVASDDVDLYWVSTVWLGLDHSFGYGPPLIFETMVFLSGTPEDTYMQRYATEAEALAGHEAIVAEIRVLAEQAAARERINDQ